MRKLPTIALASVAALALAGTAVAASHDNHVMNVALSDGSVAHIEYVGDVAPKVTVQPGAAMDDWAAAPFAPFAGFDRMMDDMNRRTEAMIRQAQQMARRAGGVPGAPIVASFGSAPAGVTSTTVVSYSNGSSTCTRTTETVSQGAGKPPKVTSSVSGECAGGTSPGGARPSAAPINRT